MRQFLFLLFAIGVAVLVSRGSATLRCMDDASWRAQVDRFLVNMTHQPEVRRSLLPRAADLFEFGCSRLERVPNPCRDPTDDKQLLKWFVMFLVYNAWEMQEGRFPFAEYPFSWAFVDEETIYRVPDVGLEIVGSAAFEAAQRGLGKSFFPPSNGAGFYVDDVVVNKLAFMNSKMFGGKVLEVYSQVHKKLVTIDGFGAPANTTAFPRYHMVSSFVQQHAYPKLRFVHMNETINTQKTLELFGVCSLCANCPAGGQCPDAPALARRDVSRGLPEDLALERERVMSLQIPMVPTHLLADAYIQRLAAARRPV